MIISKITKTRVIYTCVCYKVCKWERNIDLGKLKLIFRFSGTAKLPRSNAYFIVILKRGITEFNP